MHGTSIFEIKNQRPPAHANNPIMLNSYLYFIWVKSYSVSSESYWRSLLPFELFVLAFEVLVFPERYVIEVFWV